MTFLRIEFEFFFLFFVRKNANFQSQKFEIKWEMNCITSLDLNVSYSHFIVCWENFRQNFKKFQQDLYKIKDYASELGFIYIFLKILPVSAWNTQAREQFKPAQFRLNWLRCLAGKFHAHLVRILKKCKCLDSLKHTL